MTELTKLTIGQTLKGLKEKKFSALEVTQDYIKTSNKIVI